MTGQIEEKPDIRAKRIAAARAALAARYAADPDAVTRYEGRMAALGRARKREQDRIDHLVLGQGDPKPSPPVLVRPSGMDSRAWKAERKRLQRVHDDAVAAWDAKRRRSGPMAPPPEQMDKAPFVETDVNEYINGRKVKIGRAFSREPRFETFDWLTVAQLVVLRRYRRAFDVSELSPTKSGLNFGAGGGSNGSEAALTRVQALAFADIAVQRIEALVPGHYLPGLRLIALQDADFKAAAIARFGSASGQRRSRIKADFVRAVDAMIAGNPTPFRAQPPAAEPDASPAPAIAPAFLDERGLMRPFGEIIDIIHGRFGDDVGEAA